MNVNLRAVEQELESRGFSAEVRSSIRNARIAIIDDYIVDLKGFTQSLRNEGFTNLVEFSKIPSVDELIAKRFELIILDLKGVAGEISSDDGFGVLEHLKVARPALPVLVVTGTTTPPDKVCIASRADLIRSKPVKTLELVSDVEQLLRTYKDQYWAALEVLKELNRIDPDLRHELRYGSRIVLWWKRRRLSERLVNQNGSTAKDIISIGKTVADLGGIGLKIVEIANKFLETA
jgi:DNA-binding response OmpR family regulator